MRHGILAGLAAFAVFPAAAAVNLEYGEEYEAVYLAQCTAAQSERTCRCVMEQLQDRVGFYAFAEQVAVHRERLMQESDLRDASIELLARCTAIGSVQ